MELAKMFGTGNPFMTEYGMQGLENQQKTKEANLAALMGAEQRAQAMHPLDMESKRASTALNQSNANLNQYALSTKLPKDKALEQVMQKFHKETDDVSREQAKAKVIRMMQIARMAKAAGGVLPEGMNLTPEEMRQLSPDRLDPAIQYGETFLRYDPTEIAARQRAAEAQSLAKIRTDGQIAVKNTPGAGGKKDPTMAPPKMNLEQQMGFYNNLAFAEKDEEKKKQYQAEADRLELMIYRKAIEAQKARQAGDPNLADPRFGNLPVNPMPTPQPTPRGGSALPDGVTKSGW
jgi:hypothetical protein